MYKQPQYLKFANDKICFSFLDCDIFVILVTIRPLFSTDVKLGTKFDEFILLLNCAPCGFVE